ncbi:MAG: MFS transporter [Neisseriaceae bacterium]|nr:MFS transporter [Neisseriaceae bacterium]
MSLLSQKYGKYKLLKYATLSVSLITILLAFAPNYSVFLIGRSIQGILLAGIPAVAIAYVSEIIATKDVPSAMGLYIAGTAFGGLMGRVIAAVLGGRFNWHVAVLVVGVIALISSVLFMKFAPVDQNKVVKLSWRFEWKVIVSQLIKPELFFLFVIGFLLMGGFVSGYNYIGYHLMEPPFNLSQEVVGFVFFSYLIGTYTSIRAGRLIDRFCRTMAVTICLVTSLIGIILTLLGYLWVLVIGLLLFTAGFFATHTIVSSWVTYLAGKRRTEASALYLLFYYMGSGILGTSTGFIFSQYSWIGVVAVIASAFLTCLILVYIVHHREQYHLT